MAKKELTKKRAQTPATPKPAATSSPAPKKSSAVDNELKKLDRDILKLVSRRAALTVEHIQSSSAPDKELFGPIQSEDLTELIETQNPGPLPAPAVRAIFREVISGARQLVKGVRVVYLGPAYSFTHLAAIERFGSNANFIPVGSIASVFEEVNRGHAEYGMVPIENSTDGRIVDTLEMFTRLPLKICGEVQMSIHHHLMARCQRGEVVEIYSKPQALSQCREWLSRNMPQARLIEVTSTSTAAQVAQQKHGAAAIASRQAASLYELQIIAENIEDNKHNVTRFALIGDETTKATGKDKTAVLLQIPHKPGSLAEALVAFKRNNTNLTWIESFPLRAPEVGYLFFLDFEGHASDARTKKTLAELEKKAVRLEVLGSYPRGIPLD
jgi:chorismate mutase/prephenate dehydratase